MNDTFLRIISFSPMSVDQFTLGLGHLGQPEVVSLAVDNFTNGSMMMFLGETRCNPMTTRVTRGLSSNHSSWGHDRTWRRRSSRLSPINLYLHLLRLW